MYLSVISYSEDNDSPRLEESLYDTYVERMCKYDRTKVENYLKSSNDYNPESIYHVSKVVMVLFH